MTKAPIYYGWEDVASILHYSKSKAYGIIRELNKELAEQGYIIRPGLINKSYFNKRLGVEA